MPQKSSSKRKKSYPFGKLSFKSGQMDATLDTTLLHQALLHKLLIDHVAIIYCLAKWGLFKMRIRMGGCGQRMADANARQRMTDGGWRTADGGQQMADGG